LEKKEKVLGYHVGGGGGGDKNRTTEGEDRDKCKAGGTDPTRRDAAVTKTDKNVSA